MRVGIIGSGFMGRGLAMALQAQSDVVMTKVLTRSDPDRRTDFPLPILTRSVQDLMDNADVVVECTGDVVYATDVVAEVLSGGCPIITLDPALHITTGSYLNTLGWFSEAEGDQPGCLAVLGEDLIGCGFRPLVFGNIKGYQKLDPASKHMEVWAKHLGISLREVVANTDGTKLQIEQALVANWFGAGIVCEGMIGLDCRTLEDGAHALTCAVDQAPVVDYVIPQRGKPGVFIVAGCPDEYQHPYLEYLKLGSDPYLFSTNYHLCHLEVIKTVRRWQRGDSVLMNNGIATPSISVAAVAKHDIQAGDLVGGIGSFDTRGMVVRIGDRPDHVPIGLLEGVKARRLIEKGCVLTFDDVFVPGSLAVCAWREYHVSRD